ncbi:MAG: dephospho-CoA kinase [Lachnospiraceae bacterium]|nr:dephospho-CoA kinase [Lachnospiraceae bacterium]
MQSLSTKAGKTIGVTGGIGCGKSTVLKYLKDMYDCVILPADDIAKKLEERGGECFAPLVALLTEEVLQQNGDLNKVRFAEMIFQNEELLKEVNAIVHPAVKREIGKRISEERAKDPERIIIIESAIFVEAGYLDILDELWLVTAGEENRVNRLKETRGYSDEKCSMIMAKQFSDSEYSAYADHILDNSGDLSELYRQIDLLMTEPVFGLDIGTRSVVGTVGYMKGGLFYVNAECTKEHETRAMLDGQIHDVGKVSETIREVKSILEKECGFPLKKVCIAAAGRVLKTINIHEELSFEADILIEGDEIYELESLALEKAYSEFEKRQSENEESKEKYYLVGYSVIKEYLNGNVIGNLENQKGHQIAMDLIATFLPEEVIDGLYRAVEMAGLEVSNLTLEPIAASMVAIPEKFRLLNIALLDVGAGTSDICITNDGAILSYGMIPRAGDALTEVIAKHCLVDFTTAESIKKGISVLEEVTYEDIMGLPQTITKTEVLKLIRPLLIDMAGEVADTIKSLNGGKPVSAIFVVGGGGMVGGYCEALANAMEIPVSRVALRGEELMTKFVFAGKNQRHDSMSVTPLGICLNFYEQNNNFIFVTVNNERVKLYNNGNLHVADALMQMAVPNESIFPKRGRNVRFTINGDIRTIKGGLGEAAQVFVNGEAASIHTIIHKNDQVNITFSTRGEDAKCRIENLTEYRKLVDEAVIIIVNGHEESPYYEIQDGDVIAIGLSYEEMDLYENAQDISEEEKDAYLKEPYESEAASNAEAIYEDDLMNSFKTEKTVMPEKNFVVSVNGEPVVMKGKDKFIFVDIFDYISFDLKDSRGRKIVTKVNGKPVANYMQELPDGAIIDVYWEEITLGAF